MAQVRMVKDIPYDVKEGKVILHKPEGNVELPLEWGQNAYSVVYAYLNRKGTGRERGSNGTHMVGNFSYTVDESGVMTVNRKNGEVLGTPFTLTEAQLKYPRNAAITFILENIE